jgi:hypothetical protein
MSIIDDLIENLVERNAITLNGTFTVSLIDGGIKIKGQAISKIKDTKKNNKVILDVAIPVDAEMAVGEIVVPLPTIK